MDRSVAGEAGVCFVELVQTLIKDVDEKEYFFQVRSYKHYDKGVFDSFCLYFSVCFSGFYSMCFQWILALTLTQPFRPWCGISCLGWSTSCQFLTFSRWDVMVNLESRSCVWELQSILLSLEFLHRRHWKLKLFLSSCIILSYYFVRNYPIWYRSMIF